MSLFTDGNISGLEELRAYDTGILEVAGAEGVDLAAKLSLAATEIGIELEEFLRKRAGGGAGLVGQPYLGLENVVVTPALRQWHTLRTLALIYADIRSNHVRTRYAGKEKEYRQRARWAADSLYRIGIGLVNSPLPKAETPEVETVPGTLAGATYYIKVAWRSAAGEAGAPSEAAVHTVETEGLPAVRAVGPPANAAGFDVYAGTSESGVTKQNTDPVEPTAQWVMPETGLVSGAEPGTGQEPGWFLRNDRVLQRG